MAAEFSLWSVKIIYVTNVLLLGIRGVSFYPLSSFSFPLLLHLPPIPRVWSLIFVQIFNSLWATGPRASGRELGKPGARTSFLHSLLRHSRGQFMCLSLGSNVTRVWGIKVENKK